MASSRTNGYPAKLLVEPPHLLHRSSSSFTGSGSYHPPKNGIVTGQSSSCRTQRHVSFRVRTTSTDENSVAATSLEDDEYSGIEEAKSTKEEHFHYSTDSSSSRCSSSGDYQLQEELDSANLSGEDVESQSAFSMDPLGTKEEEDTTYTATTTTTDQSSPKRPFLPPLSRLRETVLGPLRDCSPRLLRESYQKEERQKKKKKKVSLKEEQSKSRRHENRMVGVPLRQGPTHFYGNSCTMFLLVVGLATLVFLVAALMVDWTAKYHVSYNKDSGQTQQKNAVVRNEDWQWTLRILVFLAVVLLLLGSMGYCISVLLDKHMADKDAAKAVRGRNRRNHRRLRKKMTPTMSEWSEEEEEEHDDDSEQDVNTTTDEFEDDDIIVDVADASPIKGNGNPTITRSSNTLEDVINYRSKLMDQNES